MLLVSAYRTYLKLRILLLYVLICYRAYVLHESRKTACANNIAPVSGNVRQRTAHSFPCTVSTVHALISAATKIRNKTVYC